MDEWAKMQGRLTLHLMRDGKSCCGLFTDADVELYGAKSKSKCSQCKHMRHGFTSTLADNAYMRAHYKAMGLHAPYDALEINHR